jgi:hypothetical protein
MFFLLPKVTVALLLVFGLLVGVRMWRQRHSPLRRRRGPIWRRRAKTERSAPLLPASLLKGAERTWVVFTSSGCAGCRRVTSRLRAGQPDAEVAEVDCAGQPALAELFAVRRHPTVLVANRYGQVESRLVGVRAVGQAIKVAARDQVRRPA